MRGLPAARFPAYWYGRYGAAQTPAVVRHVDARRRASPTWRRSGPSWQRSAETQSHHCWPGVLIIILGIVLLLERAKLAMSGRQAAPGDSGWAARARPVLRRGLSAAEVDL